MTQELFACLDAGLKMSDTGQSRSPYLKTHFKTLKTNFVHLLCL